MRHLNKQSGFTLIETLVSLVLISIGILSFALMQAESMRATHTSLQRTKAIHFASDMLERVRANVSAVIDNPANYTTDNSAPANAPANACSDAGAVDAINCTPVQLAEYDVWEWKTDITQASSGLINGAGAITVTGANPPYNATITISWSDRKENNSYTLTSLLMP